MFGDAVIDDEAGDDDIIGKGGGTDRGSKLELFFSGKASKATGYVGIG